MSSIPIVTKISSRVDGKEFAVEAKPVRRGFLRKGGGRHDPEDFEVILMPASKLSSCQPPSYPHANLQVILMPTSKLSSCQPPSHPHTNLLFVLLCQPPTYRWFSPTLETTTGWAAQGLQCTYPRTLSSPRFFLHKCLHFPCFP